MKSEYGVSRKWNFLCTKKYWKRNKNGNKNLNINLDQSHMSLLGQSEVKSPRNTNNMVEESFIFSNNFEPVAESLRRQEEKE